MDIYIVRTRGSAETASPSGILSVWCSWAWIRGGKVRTTAAMTADVKRGAILNISQVLIVLAQRRHESSANRR